MSQFKSIITNNLAVGVDLFPRILNGQATITGPLFSGASANVPIAMINVAPPLPLIGGNGLATPILPYTKIGMNIAVEGSGIIVTAPLAITANGAVIFNGVKTQNGSSVNNGIKVGNGVDVDNTAAISNGVKVNSSKNVTGSASIAPKFIGKLIGVATGNKVAFDIPHATKKGKRIRHIVAEGPEAGIYIRGKLKGNVIDLPEYWNGLVDPETITVTLTAFGRPQNLYVKDIPYGRKVIIANEDGSMPDCHYEVWVARWLDKDNHEDKLHVVYDGESYDDYPGNNDTFWKLTDTPIPNKETVPEA